MAGRSLNEDEINSYDVLSPELARRVRVFSVPFIPGGYLGITLGSCILLACDVEEDGSSALLAHELVHVQQWYDHGRLGFSRRYLSSFGKNLTEQKRWKRAYQQIDAEIEARLETVEWLQRRAQESRDDEE